MSQMRRLIDIIEEIIAESAEIETEELDESIPDFLVSREAALKRSQDERRAKSYSNQPSKDQKTKS